LHAAYSVGGDREAGRATIRPGFQDRVAGIGKLAGRAVRQNNAEMAKRSDTSSQPATSSLGPSRSGVVGRLQEKRD